jgi:hypothetical protein
MSPKAREECRLLGKGETYGKIARSMENVKKDVQTRNCSDIGAG